jgi:bifunctional non-homologous end joining protein LigD
MAAPSTGGDPAERLTPYRAKRDFEVTGEPAGQAPATGESRFVIQEHHARRLHWDLRLERDGVLVSWAVPKGLPESPGRNHFAARTEDHPLEYIDFHGEIPQGEYGAGSMKIWDRGTYETLKWDPRKIEVALHGERLDARYALFAIGQDETPKDWMVHRMDPPADPDREPMPDHLPPMRARPGPLPSDDERWGHEFRWAGERAVAYSEPGVLRLEARDLQDLTGRFPELGRLNRALSSHGAILDGVIVAFDADGRPSREALARRAETGSPAQLRRLAADLPATYVIFDLLWLDGHSLLDLPYADRRRRLASLALAGDRWRTPDHVVGRGAAVLAASAAHGLGGVVAKRLDSAYEPGRRVDTWIEVDADGQATAAPNAPLPNRRARAKSAVTLDGREIALSNLDKVLYPRTGTTKRDVIDYYAAIAPVLLPHVQGRGLTVKRWPDGVDGKSFFQKQAPAHRPDWVRTVALPAGSKMIDYLLVDDAATLVWLANLAALELHAPLAAAAAPARPAAVVFDLDPGAPATIVECCEVAVRLRAMFDRVGLRSFPKTSGSKGLQVYVPLGSPDVTFTQTKAFSRMIAELLAGDEPELVVARMAPALRTGRVFVDWSQNDQQKTTVAAYSLRARDRPTVSTPLDWDEVGRALDSGDPDDLVFDARAVVDRVADRGDLLAPLVSVQQQLPRW